MTADASSGTGGTGPQPSRVIEPDGADRRRQAVLTVLVAILVAALCVVAGVWQWSRHVDRATTAERVEANFGAGARPLDRVLDESGTLPPESEWTPTTVRGRYLAADGVTLRNRPVMGVPAVRLLHPLQVTDGPWSGRVLIVDRGWVPTADGEERRPRAGDGVVEIVVRLRPTEPGDPERAVVDGARQVRSIVPESVMTVAGADVGADRALDVYGLLVTENGAPAPGVSPLPVPDTSFGNNLSYAFQWWVFALGALVGAVVLVRRDQNPSAEDDQADGEGPATHGPVGAPGAADGRTPRTRGSTRRRRRPTAEEEEDALLDAQTRTVSRGPA